MTDAILNVPYSSLRNKTKIIINNAGGGVAGPLADVSIRGKNDSWTWQGIIKDDRPGSSRTNQQWVVVRKFYFNNVIEVVNNAVNNYEKVFPQWRDAANAMAPYNTPMLFSITCDTNLGGSVQTSLPTHGGGAVTSGIPTRDSRIMGLCPYAPPMEAVYQGTDGNADLPVATAVNLVGGRVHENWEEGVLMPNIYNRSIGFEIMDAAGNSLVLRTQNLAGDNRSTAVNTAIGPGVLVNWILELDVYDIIPRDERQQAIH